MRESTRHRKAKMEMFINISKCEVCGTSSFTIYDTRETSGIRRRRRKCLSCGHRSTTYEISKTDFDRILEEKII